MKKTPSGAGRINLSEIRNLSDVTIEQRIIIVEYWDSQPIGVRSVNTNDRFSFPNQYSDNMSLRISRFRESIKTSKEGKKKRASEWGLGQLNS